MTTGLKLFISHSSHDIETARAVVNLMKAALNLRPEEIRCTSVDGYRLPAGADTDEQLRQEILTADGFIGIISPKSIASAYVLFELGGRWGASKSLAPLLAPGVDSSVLKGPLMGLNTLSCDSEGQLHQLVVNIAQELSIVPNPPSTYLAELKAVMPRPGGRVEVLKEASEEKNDSRLGTDHAQVVRVFAASKYIWLLEASVADELKWGRIKAIHYLEELMAAGYVLNQTTSGQVLYSLSKKGRAYAVEHNLT